jgi:hypothetical protein
MLALGVFEGKYCNGCRGELPESWFKGAKIAAVADPALNCFGIKSRQPLSVWRDKGWIIGPDPRGWFQWYCRYWLGRRLPEIDARQIKRWRAFARHAAQVRKNCEPGDIFLPPAPAPGLAAMVLRCVCLIRNTRPAPRSLIRSGGKSREWAGFGFPGLR